MRALLTASLLITSLATPALASGSVVCSGSDGTPADVLLTVGRVPGFVVVDARVHAGGQDFTTRTDQPGMQVTVVQAAQWGDAILVDLADLDALDIVVSLRIMVANDPAGQAAAGVLQAQGVGVWPVICEVE